LLWAFKRILMRFAYNILPRAARLERAGAFK